MALSNCRSNGQGLRLRYRLEVFGYARDDLCASGAAVPPVSRRSLAVHLAAARTPSTVGRLAAAVLELPELCTSVVPPGSTVVLSLSAAAVFAATQT